MMRIAVFYPDASWLDPTQFIEKPDAAFIQQQYILSGLAKRHEFTLIAPSGLHQIAYQKMQGEIKTASQTWSSSFVYQIIHRLVWRVQKLVRVPYLNVFSNYSRYDALLRILPQQDLVYERNSLYNVSVAMACKKLRLPYVIFFDADQILEQDYIGQPVKGIQRWRALRILKFNLHNAGCIVSVSEPAKRHLVDDLGVSPEKIVVFPNGVDVDLFKPSDKRAREVRAQLGFKPNQQIFLFVGNFYKWHDVPTLLNAFANVIRLNPSVRLLLVGGGSQLSAMQAMASELKIDYAVKFTGLLPHREIPGYINAADIGIVPAPLMEHDLWLSPMKLFEYMASGLAIIATGVGQIAQVVENERNGLLVPPGDSMALETAMKRLIDDVNFRIELANNARLDALEHYSWDHYVNRLNSVFQSVIENRPMNVE